MPRAGFQKLYLDGLPETHLIAAFPHELGTMQRVYFPENSFRTDDGAPPFVIHIQDAHAHPEVQSKIRDILNWLLKSAESSNPMPAIAVALEGASGGIHPEYLEYFKEFPASNGAAIDDLYQKGELTGAELFAWDQYNRQKDEKNKS
ncbi:MAG TPA: hypothetical protein VD913_01980, partial [bacterium]|nr:hypothetical protein [bacterium]